MTDQDESLQGYIDKNWTFYHCIVIDQRDNRVRISVIEDDLPSAVRVLQHDKDVKEIIRIVKSEHKSKRYKK